MKLSADTITQGELHKTARQCVEAAATIYRLEERAARGDCSPAEAVDIVADAVGYLQIEPPAPYAPVSPIHEIVAEMETRGGSFAQKLAAAMLHADDENLSCIIAAFPKMIERYDAFATITAQEREAANAG